MATTAKVVGYLPQDTTAIRQDALARFSARADHVPRHRVVRPAYAL